MYKNMYATLIWNHANYVKAIFKIVEIAKWNLPSKINYAQTELNQA